MSYQLEHSNVPKSLRDIKAFNPTQYRFCLAEQIITPDQSYVSQNQKLVGGPNPKTLKPTVIVAPPAADFWRESHVVPHGINASTNEDVSQSGYIPDSSFYWDRPSNLNLCCGNSGPCDCDNLQPYNVAEELKPLQKQIDGYYSSSFGAKSLAKSQSDSSLGKSKTQQPPIETQSQPQIEGYHSSSFGAKSQSKSQSGGDEWRRQQCTFSNMACVGDPSLYKENAEANLPINRMVGDCYRTQQMSDYNKELHTSTIEPGIYTRSSVVEPAQYNIGISHTEQFEPLALTKDKDGLLFQQLPHGVKLRQPAQHSEDYPNISNVYDPRFTGYGTSYRSYNNRLLGQPDFFYDDVDSVRRPNFIIRSNIDHNQWANHYGPMDPRKGGCIPYTAAQNQYLADTGSHRTEIQERLMRKFNTQVGWQRRIAPLRRDTGANFTYR